MTNVAQQNFQAYERARSEEENYREALEGLWQDMECAMCMEPCWEPLVYVVSRELLVYWHLTGSSSLTCGHIFCDRCVQQIVQAKRTLECGQCRARSSQPYKVFALKQMVRTVAAIIAPDEQHPV